MGTKSIKKLLPILIPMFLILGAATPKLTTESLFGAMQEGQPMLVYNFVWVPLLEISVMIAEHILPPNAITSPKADCNQKTDDTAKPTSTDLLMNTLLNREPFLLKQFNLSFVSIQFAAHLQSAPPLQPFSRKEYQNTGILMLVALIFLFKPMLARSDVPA